MVLKHTMHSHGIVVLKHAMLSHAPISGKVKFTSSFQYNTREEWLRDCDKHGVEPDNERFGFKEDVPKFGWDVEVLER